MWAVTLIWDQWRAVIAAMRGHGVPFYQEHAALLEQRLEEHGPEEAAVRLTLSDNVFLRSMTWALHTLGISYDVAKRG